MFQRLVVSSSLNCSGYSILCNKMDNTQKHLNTQYIQVSWYVPAILATVELNAQG